MTENVELGYHNSRIPTTYQAKYVAEFDIPIAFCTFNRPESTRRVFETVRAVRPAQLLLISDGPRSDVPNDRDNVAAVREIVSAVDWDCDVKTHFSETNLGCKNRMATGIDWAFEHTEQLIILEDDCLPDPSFFGYCRELLERYRNDERVMMISGDNFQPQPTTEYSYYFSRWAHIWGWATWKRAWQHFDVEVSSWPEVRKDESLRSIMSGDAEYQHWVTTLDYQHAGEIDTWDFPWMYAMWINHGLCILPEKNLVTNLGFGIDATHTVDENSKLANMRADSLGLLQHPPRIFPNYAADLYSWKNIFRPAPSAHDKVVNEKKNWLRRILKKDVA